MMLIRGIYGVVYSTIIIGMLGYIIIIIYEVPTSEIVGSAELGGGGWPAESQKARTRK